MIFHFLAQHTEYQKDKRWLSVQCLAQRAEVQPMCCLWAPSKVSKTFRKYCIKNILVAGQINPWCDFGLVNGLIPGIALIYYLCFHFLLKVCKKRSIGKK